MNETEMAKSYLESLKDPDNKFSGDIDLLPKKLRDQYDRIFDMEGEYQAEYALTAPIDRETFSDRIREAKKKFIQNLESISQKNERADGMKAYLDSLAFPGNYLSGDPLLLPENLLDKYVDYISYEQEYFRGKRFEYDNNGINQYSLALKETRMDYFTSLMDACEQYLSSNNIISNNLTNNDMNTKKKTTGDAESTSAAVAEPEPKQETQAKEKRPPQCVTVNGDNISHAHFFKAKDKDQWFFTAKINGQPLRAQPMLKEHVDKFAKREMSVEELMKTYYPTKMQKRLSRKEFAMPQIIQMEKGEKKIEKFNVYKETNVESPDFGHYKFYACVDGKSMSTRPSQQDLNAYFDAVETPQSLVAKNFGDKLGIKAFYEKFKLPEGVNISSDDIHIKKNSDTNRYEITAGRDGYGTIPKELSYEDRQAYFNKSANKEQLAAKYLTTEITALSQHNTKAEKKEHSLSR